jgi:hypothetical protein
MAVAAMLLGIGAHRPLAAGGGWRVAPQATHVVALVGTARQVGQGSFAAVAIQADAFLVAGALAVEPVDQMAAACLPSAS